MKLDSELTHTYIITDMMIRILERDMKHLHVLKSESILTNLFTRLLKDLMGEKIQIKNTMASKGIVFQSEHKIDELFTGYSFAFKGAAHELRYSNHALKNHTLNELERRINK